MNDKGRTGVSTKYFVLKPCYKANIEREKVALPWAFQPAFTARATLNNLLVSHVGGGGGEGGTG